MTVSFFGTMYTCTSFLVLTDLIVHQNLFRSSFGRLRPTNSIRSVSLNKRSGFVIAHSKDNRSFIPVNSSVHSLVASLGHTALN